VPVHVDDALGVALLLTAMPTVGCAIANGPSDAETRVEWGHPIARAATARAVRHWDTRKKIGGDDTAPGKEDARSNRVVGRERLTAC
jgi:hypothetical protein